jgi:hypothetical protein
MKTLLVTSQTVVSTAIYYCTLCMQDWQLAHTMALWKLQAHLSTQVHITITVQFLYTEENTLMIFDTAKCLTSLIELT